MLLIRPRLRVMAAVMCFKHCEVYATEGVLRESRHFRSPLAIRLFWTRNELAVASQNLHPSRQIEELLSQPDSHGSTDEDQSDNTENDTEVLLDCGSARCLAGSKVSQEAHCHRLCA